MERYRSGHNEAVLKTVCPKGRMGSNPISPLKTIYNFLDGFFMPKDIKVLRYGVTQKKIFYNIQLVRKDDVNTMYYL